MTSTFFHFNSLQRGCLAIVLSYIDIRLVVLKTWRGGERGDGRLGQTDSSKKMPSKSSALLGLNKVKNTLLQIKRITIKFLDRMYSITK